MQAAGGGLSLGFQREGFDIVAAFEFWDAAVKCYQLNFSHPVYQADLSDTDNAIRILNGIKPEVMIGGPPCQDFSHAGKRIEANRATLTGNFAAIVAQVHPPYFVMENVDRARNSNAYAQARSIFKDAGYGLTEIVLDASLCGTHNTDYSSKVIGDQISRMGRADSMKNWDGDETYLFFLEKEDSFASMTVSVRSQMRKAVKLYSAYAKELSKIS